jgi:uncharacterized membrane protein YcaP (DUF421 family)
MKIMGKREIGELEVGELITTLLLSEVCSLPIDDLDIPLINAIIPVVFIVSLEVLISAVKNKSLRLKHIFEGKPVMLVKDGVIDQKQLSKNRISIEEFFSVLRQNSAGSLSDVAECILEANGRISVVKKQDGFDTILISDGEIAQKTADALGYTDKKIRNAIDGHEPEEIFLLATTREGTHYYILKEENE